MLTFMNKFMDYYTSLFHIYKEGIITLIYVTNKISGLI